MVILGGMVRFPPRVLDVIGTVMRLGSAAVWLIYGVTKALDTEQFYVAIQGYELLPHWLSSFTAITLPYVEIIIGLLLLVGVTVRWTSVLAGLLLLAFMLGIAQAWARGLTIDCGCLGGGGQVAAEETNYPVELLRDLGFLAMSAWLVIRPRTLFALERPWDEGIPTGNDLTSTDTASPAERTTST